MVREISRPSTARCTLPMYMGYLLSEPNSPSCCHLSEVMDVSHDSVNRFLQRNVFAPRPVQRSQDRVELERGRLERGR